MIIIKTPVTNDFNTLVLSKDHNFFDEIVGHLSHNAIERTLKLSHNLTELQPIELWLSKCDILICDFRKNDYSLLEIATLLVESSPIQLVAIGLVDGPLTDNTISSTCVHFTEFISMQDGWKSIWNHILKIKHSWDNPQIVSKIEDAPVSDLLQMIASCQWNSIVQIQGRVVTLVSDRSEKKTVERIRGRIFFWKGKPIAAWSSRNLGVPAVCDLLSLKQGNLRVSRLIQIPSFRNIQIDIQNILMSYAVSLDELDNQSLSPVAETQVCAVPLQVSSDSIEEIRKIEAETTESFQPLPFLHSWWAEDIVPLCEALINIEPNSLPLRWMKPHELKNLMFHPNTQSEFLVFRAPQQFLTSMLNFCTHDYAENKFNNGWIPIVRLGRHQKLYLYMACLEIPTTCLSLSAFPCAVYSIYKDLSSTLQSIKDCGHPVGIFLIPDNEHALSTESIREKTSPYIRKNIAAPCLSWESISQTIAKILITLSDFSSEKT
jgi:hypothetical protein